VVANGSGASPDDFIERREVWATGQSSAATTRDKNARLGEALLNGHDRKPGRRIAQQRVFVFSAWPPIPRHDDTQEVLDAADAFSQHVNATGDAVEQASADSGPRPSKTIDQINERAKDILKARPADAQATSIGKTRPTLKDQRNQKAARYVG